MHFFTFLMFVYFSGLRWPTGFFFFFFLFSKVSWIYTKLVKRIRIILQNIVILGSFFFKSFNKLFKLASIITLLFYSFLKICTDDLNHGNWWFLILEINTIVMAFMYNTMKWPARYNNFQDLHIIFSISIL